MAAETDLPLDTETAVDASAEASQSLAPADTSTNTGAVNDTTEGVVAGGDNAAATDGAAAASQPDPNAWRKPFEELGFKDLESQEQANARIAEAYRQRDAQYQETRRQLHYMQSVHARLENLGGNSPQPSATAAPEKPSDLLSDLLNGWQEPDRELVSQYVVQAENGVATWRPDTPAELRNQVDQYKLKKAAWHKALDDPRQLDQIINQRVERMLEERIESTLTQRDTRTADERAEEQFLADNTWLFETDPISNTTAIDPSTGRQKLSREGQQFTAHLEHVRSTGVTRRSDQLELAAAMFRAQQNQVRQAPTQQRTTAQPTIDQQRAAMLGRTNPKPVKQTAVAGLSDGAGADRTGAKRQSWGAALVGDLTEERVI